VPDDTDGRVLTEIVSERHLSAEPIRYEAGGSGVKKREIDYSEDENSEVIESLKNLGYMG
jgi:hypothetical protein